MRAHLESSVIVPWDAASVDPRAQLIDRTLVQCSAFTLSAWDPLSQTHLHQTLASDGYSEKLLDHINDDFVKDNPAFTIAHQDDPRSLRWRDCERGWNLWFPETLTAREFLIPSVRGLDDVLAVVGLPLRRCFPMKWTTSAEPTDEPKDITQRFRPILAELCDRPRTPPLLAEGVAPNSFALVISSSGAAFNLLARAAGRHLGEGGANCSRKCLGTGPRDASCGAMTAANAITSQLYPASIPWSWSPRSRFRGHTISRSERSKCCIWLQPARQIRKSHSRCSSGATTKWLTS